MGLFISEDRSYDMNVRQTGFRRYKQLLSLHFGSWWKIHLITVAGFMPLAFGVLYALLSSSTLILLPASILGGMIAGPFLAGLYDAILRGLELEELQTFLETELEGEPDPRRSHGADDRAVRLHGHAVILVGRGIAHPGDHPVIPLFLPAFPGGQHALLAPIGAL